MLAAWVLNDAIRHQTAPRGWASTLVVVLFMGAIQLLSLGIIGEYIRLIFLETKNRPTYIVAELKRHDPDDGGRSRFGTPRRAIRGRTSFCAFVGRSMITTWSQGEPDAFMPGAAVTELSGLIRRHPWWQARAAGRDDPQTARD